MATFVLIHGSWHGAWCWSKVIPLLKKAGHSAIAPDLPGHGQNLRADIETIGLKDYADCVTEILDAQAEQVILVGHSFGGTTISQVAEYRPRKIRKLVYLCAFLPRDGQPSIPGGGRGSGPLNLSDEGLKERFYGDCSEDDFLFARQNLVPEPSLPVHAPVHVTEKNFGSVPRAYILATQDRAISPARQREMLAAVPCSEVVTINTSHSPFFSAPEELARDFISLV
jgi:pimeloyl-ACP methyl ester carboxylesterase